MGALELSVTAAPILTEELEGVLQDSITAAPLDTTQNETIELLVPLPDAVYDPDILVTEQVDPAFQQEVDAATGCARAIVLQHRKLIAQEANALAPALAQPTVDPDAGLTAAEIAARDGRVVIVPDPNEVFGTTLSGGATVSVDMQSLLSSANAPPYTVTAGTVTVPLFNQDDMADLQTNGLQHFIDRINARLDKANDLLDLAFLTAQTDIYRYRQNVLNTTDATRLAVSPILANIATGVTAAGTAQNIQDYLTSLRTQTAPVPPTTTTPPPAAASSAAGAIVRSRTLAFGASNTFLNVTKAEWRWWRDR